MYTKGDKTLSPESALDTAQAIGLTVEEWANKYGWSLSEGKTAVPGDTTPPTGPEKKTAAGDSSLADTSLESPEIDFSITADDLKADEGNVVAALNNKLSQYGLIAKEGTAIGSFNAINIEKRREDYEGTFIFSTPLEIFTSYKVGADLSEDELLESVNGINELVKKLGDTSYLTRAQDKLGNKWNEFKEVVTPVDKTEEELAKEYKTARLDKFEDVRAKYNKINANKFRAVGANQNVKSEVPTVEDFGNEQEYNSYLAWQKGDLIADPNEDELARFDLEQKQAFEKSKSAEFASDMSTSERQALDALVDNKVKILEKDIKSFDELRNKGEIAANRTSEIIQQYNDNPTLDNFNIAKGAVKEVREIETAILNNANSLKENIGEDKYIRLAVDVLKKDYNRLRQMRNVAKGMAADVWTLGAELDEMMGVSYEGEYDKAVALKRETMREGEGFQRNLTIDEISSTKDAGRWIAGAATNLLPSLGLAATGPAALPLFFMTGAGGKIGEMAVAEEDAAIRLAKNAKYLEENPNIDELEKSAIEMEMAEDSKTLNIEDWRKYSVSALYGAAEVVFEKIGTLHLLKSIGKTARGLKPTNIKEGLKTIGNEWGKGLYREGGSEWATTLTGNVGDILILGEDKNIFEGGLESFAQGGLMGVGMVSINTPRLVKEAVVGELATRKENKRLKEIVQRISELTNRPVQNIDQGALGKFGNLTPEVRRMVEELTLEADGIKDQILEGLGTKYSAQDLFKIGEHNRKLRKIESEWSQIAANPQYSASQLKAFETEYRAKYEAEVEARDKILEDEVAIAENLKDANARSVIFDATQGYAMYNTRIQTESLLRINAEFDNIGSTQKQSLNDAAKAELEKEGVEITNDSVKSRTRKNYIDSKYRELIEKGRDNVIAYIEANKDKGITPPESFDGDNATDNLIARAEKLGYPGISELKKDLKNGRTEGLNWQGNKLIHMPNSIKNRRIGVFAHEVLHDEADLGIQSKDGNEAGQVLLNYLEKNQPELFTRVKERLDKNYVEVDGETGEAKRNKYYQEEALTALSDLLADGYTPDANMMEQVKLLLSKILPKWAWTKLSDDAAIYQFVLDYNRSAHFGGKAKIKNPFIRAIGQEPEDQEGKQSRTVSAERAKEVLDKVSANMDFFDPNSPLIARVLPGMIQAQLSKLSNKGLQFDMDEAVSDIIYRLYSNGDINKFDGRGTLYGYMNGRIGFRIKDMLKAAGEGKNDIVEDFNQSDVEDLKGAAAEVTTTEQIEERTEAERPTYRRLLDSRMATPELEAVMLEKIPRIVGTVKNRIDAPVSKNTTVTPLVNEIRLALGKQLDIDLKKAMGGKKDGVLRRFLTDNKKAILENMTTTYLMTAFPAAIQKKVDGVWTSDWKGKKIDRETTDTDKAGRTSGADLVRRLPNASTKIDDKTFLSFILDEKGNPLRGKKESLAKAISEEMAIEFIIREMKNPDSIIRQAFEANQERLDVELSDTFVTELEINFERGNVKYSQSDIETVVQLLSVIKFQPENTAEQEILINSLPEELREKVLTFTETILGTKKRYFVDTIRETITQMAKNNNGKLDPKKVNAQFVEYLDKFIALETSNKKPGFKETEKLIMKFNNKLLNALHPAAVTKIGTKGFFGLNKQYFINPENHKEFLSKLGKKKNVGKKTKESSSFNFNIDDVHILDDNSDIIIGIKEIQKKNISKEAKEKEFNEKYGERVEKLNIANPKMFSYIMSKAFDAALVDQNSVLALMAILQKQSGIRGPITGLTTFTDIEFLDGPQTPFINKSTGEGVLEISKEDAALYGTEIVDNVNHPYYNEAKEFAKTSKYSWDKLLRPYREHGWPQSKQMAFVIGAFANALQQIGGAQPTLASKNIFIPSIDRLSSQFNQQLNSKLASAIQDKKLGDTSEAGDIRMLTLPAKILRNFYDVSAKKPSAVRINEALNIELPGIAPSEEAYIKANALQKSSAKYSISRPTAVFMVGGPGSGKSSTLKALGLIDKGYRLVNQDPYLEEYIKEAGLPADEKTYDKEQRSLRAKLGWKARKAAEEDLARNTAGRESMVVDGTGASYKATTKKMKALEDAGFEIHMVFVNTSKDVAVQRNRARAERSLADFIVTKTWDSVQESAKQYKQDYGDRFYEINTDNISYGEALPEAFVNQVTTGLEASGVKFSQSLSTEFNEMIEQNKGVAADKVYSKAQARMMGERKGKYRLFVPASAEDFRGLTSYTFAGKGKQGEADQKFFEDNLITPYVRGIAMIEAVKQQIRRELVALRKADRKLFRMLGKKITNTDYTYDQALRVYMWTQQGIEVPGIDKDDIRFLINEINQFPKLIELGNSMQLISRQDTWMEPGEHWLSRTLISDLNGMTEKIGRKKYLQQFIENSEAIFSAENLNKIEAIYGTRHREALEDALFAMSNGTNRTTGQNKQVNSWLNWINNSTGAIMFFNRRSAILQTLSATNFINWSDNNPLKVAAAFANQPQYWADFAMIFNSDKLKQRRSGLQTDVNQAEIANEAKGAKNKASAVIAYLLKIGFTPTQIADSFAIAVGGASFYRNRVNTYVKEGMSKEDAEKQAFEDFSKTADEAQQSSDPMLVSQEQRSVLGRLVLAFQNTPMQYTRLMKKSMQDLANGRGDAKTHISKIIYYGAVQNFVFSALQSALFAVIPGFDDEEESEMTEKELEKLERKNDQRTLRIINSMTDSVLKGSGVKGAAIATIKNTLTEYFKQEEKGFTADHTYTILQALSLSPPIGSKARKIYSAIQTKKFERDILEARGFDVTADGKLNLSPAYSIIGTIVSGVANVPLDRVVDELNSIVEALDSRNTTWQRIALGLGWKTWDVGAKNEEHDLIKIEAKTKRKEEGKAKAKETRAATSAKKKKDAAAEREKLLKMTPAQRAIYLRKNK